MIRTITRSIKWASIPVLLVVGLLSCLAGRYERLLDFVICLGALLFLQRAVWLQEYFRGAAILVIVVLFSPLFLVTKIFLMLVLLCIVTCLAVVAGFRLQPVEAL